MDPCYRDTCEFDTLSNAPLHKKGGSYRIKLGPDLLRLVRLLGLDKSQVGGREQFDSLFLKLNQIKHLGFCGRHWVGSLGV